MGTSDIGTSNGPNNRHLRSSWLYLSAGLWGSFLNFVVVIYLSNTLQWPLLLGFAAGFCLNALFNFWFSQTYLSLSRQDPNSSKAIFSSYIITHFFLFVIGSLILTLSVYSLGISVWQSTLLTVLSLSVISLFVGRIWTFVSPDLARIEYQHLDGSFYEDSTDQECVGWFRAWYHGGRFRETLALVQSVYQPGSVIYDFGCGGSEWNKAQLPLIGIDINASMLEYGKSRGQLSDYKVTELENTGLPEKVADIIVITEVLEHMPNPTAVLKEIRRCLKPNGHLVLTVPWDTVVSPFFWLFNAQCFYRGYYIGEEYYRQRCGHINHFSAQSLSKLLAAEGFSVKNLYRFRWLLLYTISTSKTER